MSKYSTVKCWYIPDTNTDPEFFRNREPSLSLIKKSILKHGYRAFAVGERSNIEAQEWYSKFLLSEEIRFYIDGSGVYQLINCDMTENEFYFEKLNIPIGYKPWIFYSWQSDFGSSRTAIKEAITEAIREVNAKHSPRQPLELVESTRSEDGAKDIVAAIKGNLDKCIFAIFDVSNVAQVTSLGSPSNSTGTPNLQSNDPKPYPNPNVVFELSYALTKKSADQVLIIKKNRSSEFSNDSVPFDFDNNRRLNYDKPAGLKQEVLKILIEFLQRKNYIRKM
jgi:hypothetical protein